MRRVMAGGISAVLIAGIGMMLTASTPSIACADASCQGCSKRGNASCTDYTCGWRWLADHE